ncbi:MAG: helix-turn-helix domain-containing protein [Patescibacteria group bacterium]
MKTKVGKEGADELYDAWVQGTPVKKLVKDFDISRQRIYQILNDYKNIDEKDKMLRAVNKYSK